MELPVTCVDTSTLKRAAEPRCNDLCEMCLDRNGKILGKVRSMLYNLRASPSAIRDGASRVTCADQIEMLAGDRSMIRGVSFRMIPGPGVSSKVALIRAARLGIIGYYLPSRIALDDLIP